MVFELILTGIGQTIGYNMIAFLAVVFSSSLMILRAGAGITALLSSFLLVSHLLATNKINDVYFLPSEWFVGILITFGLLLGFMMYMLFADR